MRLLRELWRLLDVRQRRRLVALQIVSLIMALSTLSGIAAVLPFFTVLADPGSTHHGVVLGALVARLHDQRLVRLALGIGFAVVVLIANAVNLFGALAMNRFAYAVGDSIYHALFDEYLYRDYGFHARASSAVLSSNVLFEAGRVSAGVLQHTLVLITSLSTATLIVVALLILNPLLALGAIGGLGACYLLIYAAVRSRLLQYGLLHSRVLAERTRVVNESLGAIKEITIFQAQAAFSRAFARASGILSRVAVVTYSISQSPKYVLECLTVIALVAAALILYGSGTASPWMAQLSFAAFAAYRLLPALQQAFTAIVIIRADSPALERVGQDLLLARHRPLRQSDSGSARGWRGRPRHQIVLQDVSFRYSQSAPPALDRLTLQIPAGSVAGFAGPNGAGKTTAVDVILGLLTPQSGQLLVDDIAIDEHNRRDWQTTVAYVPQDIVLLDATLAENIALGVPRPDIDVDRLQRAAQQAQLEDFVVQLPSGYDEPLGDRGVRLSGGQRQRVGIARALYRDASLLVLDEATHSLDAAATQSIMTALESLRGRCTLVLVAHQPDLLRHCDLVFDMVAGRVVTSRTNRSLREAASGVVVAPVFGEWQRDEGFGKSARTATEKE